MACTVERIPPPRANSPLNLIMPDISIHIQIYIIILIHALNWEIGENVKNCVTLKKVMNKNVLDPPICPDPCRPKKYVFFLGPCKPNSSLLTVLYLILVQ